MLAPIIHIGLHKTGSTWLQSGYFTEHPQLQVISDWRTPKEDELLQHLISHSDYRFRASACRQIYSNRVERLATPSAVKHPVITAERLSGHPYSGGYDTVRIAERLHQAFPDARVLIVIRNQVDLLRSVYRQLIEEGYRGSCEELVKTNSWKGAGFNLEMYEFDRLYEEYISRFSKDNVHMLCYEQIRSDNIAFLNKISEFIGVTSFAPGNANKKVNKGAPLHRIAAKRLHNHFRQTELNPHPVFSLPRTDLLISLLSLPYRGIRDICGSSAANIVRGYYKDTNKRLFDICPSLSLWKDSYPQQ